MFRRLNRLCAPHLYSTSDFYFVRAPRGWMAIGNWVSRRPLFFPVFLWLMLLQEERSLYFARAFVREQASVEVPSLQQLAAPGSNNPLKPGSTDPHSRNRSPNH